MRPGQIINDPYRPWEANEARQLRYVEWQLDLCRLGSREWQQRARAQFARQRRHTKRMVDRLRHTLAIAYPIPAKAAHRRHYGR